MPPKYDRYFKSFTLKLIDHYLKQKKKKERDIEKKMTNKQNNKN